MSTGISLNWLEITGSLLGGLALFLHGMDQLSMGLKAVSGDRLRQILLRLTGNRFLGLATGALVTAVIQSSSVTTVILVGFVSAGVMTLSQSVGVIMGANIGTTITAQIIAFKVIKLALPMVAVGFAFVFFARKEILRQFGWMVMGLGLVFFGMALMGEAMQPLNGYPPFVAAMVEMENPAWGILLGAAFTALLQSSSATTGLVIVLASQSLISLPAGIALVFGANIGTCATALLAAIGKPREALLTVLAHVFFNVVGVLLWLGFIDDLARIAAAVTPGESGDSVATARQIANAHSIFNLANAMLLIWFTGPIARLLDFMTPRMKGEEVVAPNYLDDSLLETPSLALDAAARELGHIGERVNVMLERAVPAALSGDRIVLGNLDRMDADIDILHQAVLGYLRRIGRGHLTDAEGRKLAGILEAANHLESIGDILKANLVHTGLRQLDEGVLVSKETKHKILDIHALVHGAMTRTLQALTENDAAQARAVVAMKEGITTSAEETARHELHRLLSDEPNRLKTYTREMEVLECLRRIYYFVKRIAKTIISLETKTNDDEEKQT